MGCNNRAYHISTDNSITTWKDIIGDPKRNKVMAEILRDILKKVDKEEGKCLIPVEELARLRTLYNYDDTYVQAQIRNIQELLDSLNVAGMRQQIYSLELALYDVDQELKAHDQRISTLERKIDNIPSTGNIPTKVSQLQNDVPYAKESDIPTKVSQLANDEGYVDNVEAGHIAGTTISELNGDVFVEED